jgi:2-oxo-4-hydroxy-4-carboxy-5-ureidoimidazoline decarboxylase
MTKYCILRFPLYFQSMLGNLTDAQFSEFETLNNAYKQRFQFPFIISLRDQKSKGVDGILAAFRQRLGNTEAQELEEAIRQIGRISHYRLIDLVQDDE